MKMTAPFMAATTNGGSVIRISTARTSVLAVTTHQLILTVVIFPLETDPNDQPFTKDHLAKCRFTLTNVVSMTIATTEANKATTALHLLLATCHPIIQITTIQIIIVIKCQWKSIIMKMKTSMITYLKDLS